jgi:hypothetical protein
VTTTTPLAGELTATTGAVVSTVSDPLWPLVADQEWKMAVTV